MYSSPTESWVAKERDFTRTFDRADEFYARKHSAISGAEITPFAA